jgi:hypothetical protein
MGWALSHKGKASVSETTYNPDDPPQAYNNPSIHGRLNVYTETGRQVHGPEWDLTSVPLDGEVNMRIGQGKKHDHYYIGDNILDSASTPTLTELQARSTRSSPPILSWPSAALAHMERLQVISILFIVTKFQHKFPLLCNIGINNCRFGWMSKKRHTRRP